MVSNTAENIVGAVSNSFGYLSDTTTLTNARAEALDDTLELLERSLTYTGVVGEEQSFEGDLVVLKGKTVNTDVLTTQDTQSVVLGGTNTNVDFSLDTLKEINTLVYGTARV